MGGKWLDILTVMVHPIENAVRAIALQDVKQIFRLFYHLVERIIILNSRMSSLGSVRKGRTNQMSLVPQITTLHSILITPHEEQVIMTIMMI